MNNIVDDFENEVADIHALSCGDTLAFDRLYERYQHAVHANILKLVKTPQLSAEILQDVFVSLWQNRFRIDKTKSIGGWLFVVSYNKSLNAIRNAVKESLEYVPEYPESHVAEEHNTEEEEMFEIRMQLLDEAVSKLPKRKREVFQMYRYEGRTKEDVAAILGLSPRSVSNYLKDANRFIKDHIVETYPKYARKISTVIFLSYFL